MLPLVEKLNKINNAWPIPTCTYMHSYMYRKKENGMAIGGVAPSVCVCVCACWREKNRR